MPLIAIAASSSMTAATCVSTDMILIAIVVTNPSYT